MRSVTFVFAIQLLGNLVIPKSINCDEQSMGYKSILASKADFSKCSDSIHELAKNLQESRTQFEDQITDRQDIINRGILDPDYNSAFYDVETAKDNLAIIDGQLQSLWQKCVSATHEEDIDLMKFMDIPTFSEGTLVEDMRDRQSLDLHLQRLNKNDAKQADEIELLSNERVKIQSRIDAGLEQRIHWRQQVAAGMIL